MVAIRKAALEEAILSIAQHMAIVINDPKRTVTVETMAAYLKNGIMFYIAWATSLLPHYKKEKEKHMDV
ncbi:hypothetical protein KIN20_007272 [Parelaphostrongylus tenuis]|uniref:Uncharacterized protein n=1 Tax=Parelaphostrongylus tenuis TaxID=148309 RepID=A0AAD5M342_PARTN|nr:hypothetical protein KIN20_007272 [Parelaphostrongylus tenuis]